MIQSNCGPTVGASVPRRKMLRDTCIGVALAALWPMGRVLGATGSRPPKILVKSSWQTVNIGDIGHAPGMIRLLNEYLPDAEVTLWPNDVREGVEEMLRRNYPKLRWAQSEDEVKRAFAESDFLLHGSGASFVAEKQVARWHKETGKPYGIYGITLSMVTDNSRDLLNNSKFIYFRDSVSLGFARGQGLTCPVMEFGPDAAFAVNLRNDEAAIAFMKSHGLEQGKFLCVIPRLRYSPYWDIRHKKMTAEDQKKHARNEEMKEHDHAPLREAIIAVARQTEMKILVCPEDQSQMAIGKEMLIDPLPDDVKPKVAWRDTYWLTDEAVSTYVRSAGLFGLEMHSPIMCVGNGVPAIVCRFKEQTTKGLMWRDIGLGDWLFDMDEPAEVARLVPTVLSLVQDPQGTRARLAKAQEIVHRRQAETMAQVARASQPA